MNDFNAGDWLKLKETLEEHNKQAKITILLNDVLLIFIETKLKTCELKKENILTQ